jgi:hypothetical protein
MHKKLTSINIEKLYSSCNVLAICVITKNGNKNMHEEPIGGKSTYLPKI